MMVSVGILLLGKTVTGIILLLWNTSTVVLNAIPLLTEEKTKKEEKKQKFDADFLEALKEVERIAPTRSTGNDITRAIE